MSDKSQLDLAVLLQRGPDEAPVLTEGKTYRLTGEVRTTHGPAVQPSIRYGSDVIWEGDRKRRQFIDVVFVAGGDHV